MNLQILFIGHDASRTGAPASLLKIIRWLKDNANATPVIVLGKSGPLLDQYQALGETIVYSPHIESGTTWSLIRTLRGRLYHIAQRSHLLHVLSRINPSCIFNNTGVNGRLVAELKGLFNVPVISRIPELEAFMRRNKQNGGLIDVLSLSDHFLAVSESVKRNLVKHHGVGEESITVVHGACDEPVADRGEGSLRRQFGIRESDTLICGCGTMDWRKGFDLFLQVAHWVCSREGRLDIKFVWVGGPIRDSDAIEYDYEVENLGLNNCFFRTGQISSTSDVFAQCDIFFLSSREDPFPLVMLEASRQALPVVFFKGSGGADEFVEGSMGRGVQMLDVPEAAQAIIEYANLPEICRRDGLAAQARSLEFDIDRMGHGVLAAIVNLLDQGKVH